MDYLLPIAIPALVSLSVTLITIWYKFSQERSAFKYKIEQEHEYNQQKLTKDAIAKNKTRLLDAAESLNHRLWNFAENHSEDWMHGNGYYYSSFVYRFVQFYSILKRVECDVAAVDTTLASDADKTFLKMLRLLKQLVSDVSLFNNFAYDNSRETDHIFSQNLDCLSEYLWSDSGIRSFRDFRVDAKELQSLRNFLEHISPNENRLRWDRLVSIHIVLMAFINMFGYDFQYTEKEQYSELAKKLPRGIKVADNLRTIIKRNKLDHQVELLTAVGRLSSDTRLSSATRYPL